MEPVQDSSELASGLDRQAVLVEESLSATVGRPGDRPIFIDETGPGVHEAVQGMDVKVAEAVGTVQPPDDVCQ